MISNHQVKVLFTATSLLRSIKKEDPKGKFIKEYNLSHLKYLFLVGERLDPESYYWVNHLIKRPVIDHWWQTETGWPVAANCMGLEPLQMKAGSPHKARSRIPGENLRS